MSSRDRRAVIAAAACAALVSLLGVPAAHAQYEPPDPTYAAPATYYNAATSNVGPTLKQQLNDIIGTGHTGSSYDQAKDRLQVLDAGPMIPDPANPSVMVPSVQLVYSGVYVKAAWDAGVTWNREHLWCDSYGIEGAGTFDYGDLFNLRPADPGVNSDRNNEYYFNIPVAQRMVANVDAPQCFEDNTIADQSQDQMWEPRPIEKGDIARSLFYMDTRYDGVDTGTTDLTLTDDVATITSANSNMGHLTTLLHWHYQDGVTNAERKRNDQIYDLYQHNRNPFIDHPEWVWAVFGGGNNNSKLYVGGTNPANGASSTGVALRVIKDASSWGTGTVTLNKVGVHPTTYDVTASGAASSTSAGVGQGIDYDTQTRAIQVSLNGPTGTVGAGIVTGTITIDNTDITTSGAGLGSQDGNDTINVTGTVIDHAQPSFASGASATAQSIDFGYVPAGFAARSANFSVYNNAAAAGAALTAGLDVDGVNKTGSSNLNTNVTPSNPNSPMAAGGSRIYIASFTAGSTEGAFSATHTIATSDENIPGATAGANLVLTTSGRTTVGNFPVTGSLFLFGGETFNTTTFNIADGATVTKTGAGVMNVNGAQSHGASASLVIDAGPVNFLSDANSTAAAGLAVTASASALTFQSPQHLRALNLNGTSSATVTTNGNHPLVVGTLAIAPAARLDVKDNDLIVHNAVAGSSSGGTYDGVQGLVQHGYNFGGWNQDGGILTTTSDAATGLTTIGVARAGDLFGLGDTDTTTWNGQIVSGADVLAMYTYAGDANLDGAIDGGDYGIIDNFAQVPSADGYFNGDFNYDGVIDGGDYGIIDNNLQSQGAPLGSSGAAVGVSGVTAVPEPSACGFAILMASPLLARRRRRSRRRS